MHRLKRDFFILGAMVVLATVSVVVLLLLVCSTKKLPSSPLVASPSPAPLFSAATYSSEFSRIFDENCGQEVVAGTQDWSGQIELAKLPFDLSDSFQAKYEVGQKVTCKDEQENKQWSDTKYLEINHWQEERQKVFFVHNQSREEMGMTFYAPYAFNFPEGYTCINGRGNPGNATCVTSDINGQKISLVYINTAIPYNSNNIHLMLIGSKNSHDGEIMATAIIWKLLNSQLEAAGIYDLFEKYTDPDSNLGGMPSGIARWKLIEGENGQELEAHDFYLLLLQEFVKLPAFTQMKQELAETLAGIEWQ